jgi:ribonuclease BN (tRNA processing enzyme)
VLAFAELTGVKTLVPFHFDPAHDDETLDALFAEIRAGRELPFELMPAREGESFYAR